MAKAKHTIRIISGTHRSRRLPVLNFSGLRPTGDRVRETLFNWLQTYIAGKNILDLCAGAGSLGFEAASRFAKNVVMVESNTVIAKNLQQIKHEFNFENVKIEYKMAQDYLANNQQEFDVVFLDPPFAENLLQQLTNLVLDQINIGGFLYREAAISQELTKLPKNWELYRQKTLGQVKIELWQKNTSNHHKIEEINHA